MKETKNSKLEWKHWINNIHGKKKERERERESLEQNKYTDSNLKFNSGVIVFKKGKINLKKIL